MTPEEKAKAMEAIIGIRGKVGTELFDTYADHLMQRLNIDGKTVPEANGAKDRVVDTMRGFLKLLLDADPMLVMVKPSTMVTAMEMAFNIGYWMAVEDAKLNSLEG